jgi:hypothetical protein
MWLARLQSAMDLLQYAMQEESCIPNLCTVTYTLPAPCLCSLPLDAPHHALTPPAATTPQSISNNNAIISHALEVAYAYMKPPAGVVGPRTVPQIQSLLRKNILTHLSKELRSPRGSCRADAAVCASNMFRELHEEGEQYTTTKGTPSSAVSLVCVRAHGCYLWDASILGIRQAHTCMWHTGGKLQLVLCGSGRVGCTSAKGRLAVE